ncbi:hypothetical protein Cpir12675_004708 [Ceratocystis pirilliformis]|uniref:Uncharacterized protein n=1 Tax=Ceratocystis pirilliformis TaxID=259994 RepID=A0ABR3YVX8_9PEZI
MNFGSIASKAGEFAEKQMGGNKSSSGQNAPDNQAQSEGQSTSATNSNSGAPASSSNSKWQNVGSQASKAYTDLNNNRAAGKPADFSEVGAVGKSAYAAYGSEGGQQDDLINLGKGIASGFSGKGGQTQDKQ